LYQERLCLLEDEIKLPPAPSSSSDHFDVYQNYELEADKRDELRAHLTQNEIGTLIQWGGKAVHQWENLGYSLSLPKVERFFDRCIMLPMNMFISDDDCHYVCDKVIDFYRG